MNDNAGQEAKGSVGAAAVVSLIMGLLAVLLSAFLVGGGLAVVGLILGVISLKRRTGRGLAIAGMILSTLGLIAAIGFCFLYVRLFTEIREELSAEFSEDYFDSSAWEGVEAPDFTIETLDGTTLKLSDLRGKRVVVDIWATWCPPCQKNIPYLVQLSSEWPDDLVVVGISDEDRDALWAFAEENAMTYPVVSAPTDALPSPYGEVVSIPTMFCIDRSGMIDKVLEGHVGYEELHVSALGLDTGDE